MRKLFIGISKMWGVSGVPGEFKMGAAMQVVDSFSKAWLCVEEGKIVGLGGEEGFFGPESLALEVNQFVEGLHCLKIDSPKSIVARGVVKFECTDLGGVELLPGFVDSHTHLVFAAPRWKEFVMRIGGESYETIAAAGGGILNSAKALQAMDEDALFGQAATRLQLMIAHGTTTVEIKSGYGLTVEAELKMLRVVRRLKLAFPIVIQSTFLGAHAIPMEYKEQPDVYVDLVINEMLPQVVAEGLADYIDVFCDRGFFSPAQTDRILKAAIAVGLPSKIHANELGLTGGVQVAVANGSLSADHLEHCSSREIDILRDSFMSDGGGTMPVALPGTSYFLGIPYAPARAMIDAGLPVALATDFNPGSSPILSLQTIWALACTQMKLLPGEALNAITCNAARALRLENNVGMLAPSLRADFFTTHSINALNTIPYFLGYNHCKQVFVLGNPQ